MPTINFELISVFDTESYEYEYYWINNSGIIISPRFGNKEDAESFINKIIFAFERKKKEQQK